MRGGIRHVLERGNGVASRAELLAVAPHHLLDRAISGGHLVRIFPRTYALRDCASRWDVRARGALVYAHGKAALSCTSGLAAWELPVAATSEIHIVVGGTGHPRGTPGLVVHRRTSFSPCPPRALSRRGMLTEPLERCLLDSWPLLPVAERRALLIYAVRQRRTTVQRLLAGLECVPKLPDRASLRRLLQLVADGCHSELEIWGHIHVFESPLLPPARRQLPMPLGRRKVYLDIAYEEEMVNVELDGAAYHGTTGQREQDLRRDAALAARGWLTVRFSHARLHAEPEAVRQELAATLDVRRRQLSRERSA